jgi:cytochrome c peroxidase
MQPPRKDAGHRPWGADRKESSPHLIRSLCGLGLIAFAALLALVAAGSGPSAHASPPDQAPPVPLGLAPIAWPLVNPYSPAKAELGRLLYFDRRLSADGSVACASCHQPRLGFTDGQPVATGVRGQQGSRSAPTVINSAYNDLQFWDGRASSLEEQAKGPIANPIEMANTHEEVVRRLKAIPGYREQFRLVFGTEEITIDHVARAIATFERTVLSGNSLYDRFQAGDPTALSPSAQRGMQLFFGRARCSGCHAGPNLGGEGFANTGVGMAKPAPDWGRFEVTRREEDRGAFKTPTLREIAATAPYMHDGSLDTLEAVVEYYNRGGIRTLYDGRPNQWLDPRIQPLSLAAQEKADLVEFLRSLSGEGWQHVQEPKQFP